MAISERARHELYEWFRENAGEDHAETMMDLVPPTGWGDIATRRDLELLEVRIHAEVAELRADIAERMRVQTLTMTTTTIAALGLFATLNQILG